MALPSLANVVVVYDCSSRLRLVGPIQPSIDVLPKRPPAGDSASNHPLEHLRLAIGYEAVSPPPVADSPHPRAKVDLSTKLLRALASDAYAYVKRARLVVQLMPCLVLDAGELERLREHFAAVVVEEIDRLPRMPVPERVRDDALAPEGFVPGSVLY